MTDDHRLVPTQVFDDGNHGSDQVTHRVSLDPLGLPAAVIATLIDGNNLDVFGHNSAPGKYVIIRLPSFKRLERMNVSITYCRS